MKDKKLPPYAKAINDARRKGMVPVRSGLGHVAIIFDWRLDSVPDIPIVVMPRDRASGDFNWQFVAGLDVFILHWDRDLPHLQSLCRELFAAKAHVIKTFSIDRMSRREDRAFLQLKIQPGAPYPWPIPNDHPNGEMWA